MVRDSGVSDEEGREMNEATKLTPEHTGNVSRIMAVLIAGLLRMVKSMAMLWSIRNGLSGAVLMRNVLSRKGGRFSGMTLRIRQFERRVNRDGDIP